MAHKTVDLPIIGQVSLYKHRKSRSIRIKVSSNHDTRVTLPNWMPYSTAVKFVNSQIDWILKQQQQSNFLVDKQPIGKAHHLYFKHDIMAQSIKSRLNQTEILITLPTLTEYDNNSAQTIARRTCIKALQHEAQALLPQRLRSLAIKYNCTYSSVHTRHLKSRWGSCSQDNSIGLNIFLMQLPWQLIDYVLLHELSHTKEHNHSAKFWEEVSKHSPDFKLLRLELRKYHPDFN